MSTSTSTPTPITVALDWTPNTNHIGFYVALHTGLYAAANLSVTLRTPDDPSSSNLTPAKQVATNIADFAVGPSESVISFATSSNVNAKPLVAVAALCQGSISAICVLTSSKITRPSDLSGRSYASYNGRFEDAIVKRMVDNDGGDGSKVVFKQLNAHGYDEDEGAMDTGSVVASHLEKGLADSTWIFPKHEGVIAERAGQHLTNFYLEDYKIPYGYSPILISTPETAQSAVTAVFLKATGEGYKIASSDPKLAADALVASGHSAVSDADFVLASATLIAPCFLDSNGNWGRMDKSRWVAFVDFLSDAGILVDRDGGIIERSVVEVDALFSNVGSPA